MSFEGGVLRDTTGAIRIRHYSQPLIRPCNCMARQLTSNDPKISCNKSYCPCRKQGVYCGASCNCCQSECCNRPPDDFINESTAQTSTYQEPLKTKVNEAELDRLENDTLLLLDFEGRYDEMVKSLCQDDFNC